MEKKSVEFWGIVELFGHQRIAGHITEAEIAGGVFIQVNVPEVEGSAAFTKLYGTNAIYAMTPTSEELVKAYVKRNKPAPLNIYMPELRTLPDPREPDDIDDDGSFEDDDDVPY